MNNLNISQGRIQKRGGWIKFVEIAFSSDVVENLFPFTEKRLNPQNYNSGTSYISANGSHMILTVTGDTWAEIDVIVQDIILDFQTKYTAFKNAQDLISSPVANNIDLDL